jgi:hypothetical protein
MGLRHFPAGFLLAASFSLVSAVSAQATPFNSSLVYAYDAFTSGAGSCGSGNAGDGDCYRSASNGLSVVTDSYSQTGPGFTNYAYAQANLYTATMKIRASSSLSNPEVTSPYSQSNATFSDGFTTTNLNGELFKWNGATATFNLNFGNNNLIDSYGNNTGAAFVILGINEKGTTDANSNWFTGADNIKYFLYEFGPNATDIYYTYNHVSTKMDVKQNYASVPTSISTSFQPGGDFDWVLLFGASGQAFATIEDAGGFDFDLSHTLTLDYVAPEGTITKSDSGVFGTQAVDEIPEPLTLALFAAGLAGLAGLRRAPRNAKA